MKVISVIIINGKEIDFDSLTAEDRGLMYRMSTRQANETRYGAIKPTNTYDACILVVMDKGIQTKSCRAWNPTADDLLADDWEVVKE